MQKTNFESMMDLLPSNVIETDVLSYTSKKVLAALLELLLHSDANDTGVIYCQNSKLRKMAGVGSTELMRSIRQLVDYELITRKAGSPEKGNASEYTINFEKITEPIVKKNFDDLFSKFLKPKIAETPISTPTTTTITTATTTPTSIAMAMPITKAMPIAISNSTSKTSQKNNELESKKEDKKNDVETEVKSKVEELKLMEAASLEGAAPSIDENVPVCDNQKFLPKEVSESTKANLTPAQKNVLGTLCSTYTKYKKKSDENGGWFFNTKQSIFDDSRVTVEVGNQVLMELKEKRLIDMKREEGQKAMRYKLHDGIIEKLKLMEAASPKGAAPSIVKEQKPKLSEAELNAKVEREMDDINNFIVNTLRPYKSIEVSKTNIGDKTLKFLTKYSSEPYYHKYKEFARKRIKSVVDEKCRAII